MNRLNLNALGTRRVIIAALALVAMGAIVYYFRQRADDANDRNAELRGDPPVTVSTARARVADVPVTIDAVGTVQALNTVTIRTQVDGRLTQLNFQEGQDVRKDDILAQIDPTIYQAQYDQAVAKKAQDEANLANAKLDLARYQKLQAGNFASAQQFATQKATVAQLEAQIRADQGAIDNTRAQLDYATIRSPIDGRTGIRLVDVGNILHPSDSTGIVVVTQLKPIFVVFTVPQQALPSIQTAEARGPLKAVALGPDNATPLDTGVLSVVDNQIDQNTGTVRIKALFDNKTLSLWPGQFVNVRLTVDTIKQATIVPSAAIQRGPSGAYVYLLNDNQTVTMKSVSVGRQDESQAVVTSGLDSNAAVLTSGFSRLFDGARVVVAAEQIPDGKIDQAAPPPAGAGGAPLPPPRSRRDRRSENAGGSQLR